MLRANLVCNSRDARTIAPLDFINVKYDKYGKSLEAEGLIEASLRMRERLGGKLGCGH